MKKILLFFVLLIIGVVVAGVYGPLHNQISYTVSSEYFTQFKFEQFGYNNSEIPERIRASIIGFEASWWMGIPIGFLIGVLGFIHPGHLRMFKISLRAMMLAVGFTLIFGICGLIYGIFQTSNLNLVDYEHWYIPDGVTNVRRFLCAGYMHNSAYLGGLFSVLIAWIYHIYIRLRMSDSE
jgi:hypothetical protein